MKRKPVPAPGRTCIQPSPPSSARLQPPLASVPSAHTHWEPGAAWASWGRAVGHREAGLEGQGTVGRG